MLCQEVCPVYLLLQKKKSLKNSGLKQNIYLFLIVSVGQELGDSSAGWFRIVTSHAVMVSQLQMELEWERGKVLEQLGAGQHLFGSSGLFYAVSPP